MKILYITQTFPPEPGATARPLNQSIYLKKLGHQVTILTTMPNYPGGKIYKGYRWKLIKKETYDGIDTVRIWSFPSKNEGKLVRTFSQLSFAFMSALCGLFLSRRDVLIASVPTIGTELAGLLIGKIKKSATILELRDVIPDNMELIGISGRSLIAALLENYYSYIYRKVRIIMATSKGMKKVLIDKGVKREKILVVPHGADANRHCDKHTGVDLRTHYSLNDRFIVMYTGSFSPYYDVVNFINAASILKRENNPVSLFLIGQGPDFEKVSRMVEEQKLLNVILTGSIQPQDVSAYQKCADIFITSLASPGSMPEYVHDYVNTKVAEYLMNGKPVLAVEDGNTIGKIITRNNLGAVIPPKEPDLLAQTVAYYSDNDKLVREQGKAAREYALEHLNREKIIQNFNNELQARLS